MQEYKKLAKYIEGMAKALNALSDEIIENKEFDKESQDLLCKIGSGLLFKAVVYDYRKIKLK